jgi:hypothetical protein
MTKLRRKIVIFHVKMYFKLIFLWKLNAILAEKDYSHNSVYGRIIFCRLVTKMFVSGFISYFVKRFDEIRNVQQTICTKKKNDKILPMKHDFT